MVQATLSRSGALHGAAVRLQLAARAMMPPKHAAQRPRCKALNRDSACESGCVVVVVVVGLTQASAVQSPKHDAHAVNALQGLLGAPGRRWRQIVGTRSERPVLLAPCTPALRMHAVHSRAPSGPAPLHGLLHPPHDATKQAAPGACNVCTHVYMELPLRRLCANTVPMLAPVLHWKELPAPIVAAHTYMYTHGRGRALASCRVHGQAQ